MLTGVEAGPAVQHPPYKAYCVSGIGTAEERERNTRTPDPRQERSRESTVRDRSVNIHNQLSQRIKTVNTCKVKVYSFRHCDG